MPGSDCPETDSVSATIALRVSSCINDITEYYRRATEGLSDNAGNTNDPATEAVLGSLKLDHMRSLVLQHRTQGQEAMLSIVWGTVEFAQMRFREVTEHFEIKLNEAKELDSRWEKVDTAEIHRSSTKSELFKIFKALLEARRTIPLVASVTIPEPTTHSSLLGSGITWERFEYAKLESPQKSIRLVRMESISASLEPPIRLTTRIVRLQDKIPYATLSYTWGSPFGVFCSEKDRDAAPRTDIPILCDGKLLEIGENLYRFLCRWRQALAAHDNSTREGHMPPNKLEKFKPPAEFWIDAICINQDDTEEKTQQVSMMGDIYIKSVTTWIWLGEDDQFSPEAFRLLPTLLNRLDGADTESLAKLDKDEVLTRLGLPDRHSWKWFAVFALFQRQWFRRSWVVQEAILSTKCFFQCGPVRTDFAFIVSAFIGLRRLDFLRNIIRTVAMHEMETTRFVMRRVDQSSKKLALLKRSSKEPSDMRYHPCREGIVNDFTSVIAKIMNIKVLDPDILSNDKNGFKVVDNATPVDKVSELLDLWDLSRNTLCGNLRDKVYALASLANSDIYRTPNTVQDRRLLEPDYEKSVCEVYCEAAWFTLLTHASLNVLSMVGHISLDSEHALPSWVPDLSQAPRFVHFWEFLKRNPRIGWLAGGGARWEIPPPAMRHGRHLRVQATFVGKIRDTEREEPKNDSEDRCHVNFKRVLEFSNLLPSTYLGHPGGQSRFEVMWRMIIADVMDGISPASPEYAVEFDVLYMQFIQQMSEDFAVGNIDSMDFIGTMAAMKDMGRLHDLSASVDQIDVDRETTKFGQQAYDIMDNRRLFIADTGYVGCGDARLSVGDFIVVIAGSCTPFLLRHGSSGRYKLIGEAYVHGIMFGEHAMKPDVEWESITLE